MSGVDHRKLQEFQKKLDRVSTQDKDRFFEDCSKELAARLLQLVIPRTPKGVYPPESGKEGGTLIRGWTGGKKMSAKAYARTLPVTKEGNYYVIHVSNGTEYASYVEYGHRQTPGRYVPAIHKRLKKAWVPGKFFLRISVQDLRTQTPAVLERKIDKFLRDTFQ